MLGGGAATALLGDGEVVGCLFCIIPASAAAGPSLVVSAGLCAELEAGVCSDAASFRGD